jgi:DNA-binding MarR family transcriptional regulator
MNRAERTADRENLVHRIRAFNRFYMPIMNLLGGNYLGSGYSATEARVLFELYEREGCNAAAVARSMNIDKSYLSRVVHQFLESGCLRRVPSREDKRSFCLYLTEKGRALTEHLIRRSDADIRSRLGNLTAAEEQRFRQALDTMTALLKKGMNEEDGTL